MNKLFLIITMIILSSCGTKKTTVENKSETIVEIKKDSIVEKVHVVDTVYVPSSSIFSIPSMLDRDNKYKPFEYRFDAGHSEVKVSSDSTGRLQVESIGKALKSSYKDVYTSDSSIDSIKLEKTVVNTKEVIRYKIPFWIWPTGILLVLIIIILIREKITNLSLKSLLPWK